ncbi:hypothetical protein BCR43DRAFT_481263 [Syncephalastrum racemosum]|uniref:Uncharacterized protein n=1 Tax=Syncephalastrum racemosum TaxID=13706 RepID=A0A1X2HT26_SYNRA|nr:hypothetical protein BCR43DRAFT_481263 [Syncephalastrum racemosum]
MTSSHSISDVLSKDHDLSRLSEGGIDTLTSTLHNLEEALAAIRKDMFSTVYTNLDAFISSYDGNPIHDRVIRIAQKDPKDSTALDALHTFHQLRQETQKNDQEIAVLRVLDSLVEAIETAERSLDAADETTLLAQTTRHLLDIKTRLETLPNDTSIWLSVNAVSILEARQQAALARLTTHCQETLGSAVVVTESSLTVRSVPFADLMQSLSQLGLLSVTMADLTRRITRTLLPALLDHHLHSTRSISDPNGRLTLQFEPVTANDGCAALLASLGMLFDFFAKHVFGEATADDRRLFGNLLLPDVFEIVIHRALEPAIPATPAELPSFDAVATAASALEQQCVQCGFWVDEARPLTAYVTDMDAHFGKKRRNKILSEGRQIMMRRLYETEEEPTLGKITQTPKVLAILLQETLAEADGLATTHPVSAAQLIQVLHDLLDLYRALMPHFHRDHFLAEPAHGLCFRNDCYWFAHAIQRLPNHPQSLDRQAEQLRVLGESWYDVAVTQQFEALEHILRDTDHFIGITEPRRHEQCDRALMRVVERIGAYAMDNRDVVEPSLYLDLTSQLVDRVLTRLIDDVEQLDDIGADDSHLIARSLNSMVQLVGVFDVPGQDATDAIVADLVDSWKKFWMLNTILESGLRDIMQHYRQGELWMFAQPELIRLVCALFADTELRAASIHEINSTRPPKHGGPFASSSPSSLPLFAGSEPEAGPQTRTSTQSSLFAAAPPLAEDEADGWGWDDDMQDLHAEHAHATSASLLAEAPPLNEHETEGWGSDVEVPFAQHATRAKSSPSALAEAPPLDEHETAGWGSDDDGIFDRRLPTKGEPSRMQPSPIVVAPPLDEDDVQGWASDEEQQGTSKHADPSGPSPLKEAGTDSKPKSQPETAQPRHSSPSLVEAPPLDDDTMEGWGSDTDMHVEPYTDTSPTDVATTAPPSHADIHRANITNSARSSPGFAEAPPLDDTMEGWGSDDNDMHTESQPDDTSHTAATAVSSAPHVKAQAKTVKDARSSPSSLAEAPPLDDTMEGWASDTEDTAEEPAQTQSIQTPHVSQIEISAPIDRQSSSLSPNHPPPHAHTLLDDNEDDDTGGWGDADEDVVLK